MPTTLGGFAFVSVHWQIGALIKLGYVKRGTAGQCTFGHKRFDPQHLRTVGASHIWRTSFRAEACRLCV